MHRRSNANQMLINPQVLVIDVLTGANKLYEGVSFLPGNLILGIQARRTASICS